MAQCQYQREDGSYCPSEALGGGYCYWHDPNTDKQGQEVKARLEAWGATGESMEGFQLERAQLEGLRFPHDLQHGPDLKNANLNHANLKGAHLFHANLEGANLLKANCEGANLNVTRLGKTNLLGIKLAGAKMEHIHWGKECAQEIAARKANQLGKKAEARELYQECEETYRLLFNACEERKLIPEASSFFYRSMLTRHQLLKSWSLAWWWSHVARWVCGYGERPARVVGFSAVLVLLCSVLYFILGVQGPEGLIIYNSMADAATNFYAYAQSLYFSVVTFTTLGYGDLRPIGFSRLVAATEAFFGAFSMALFVVVFVRKMVH